MLCSCTKAIIPEVPASRVLPSQSKARGVDLCVAVQEHFKRSGLAGVADPDGPDWHFAIASIIVKHPAGLTIIDPAFGRSIARDIARAGLLFSVITGSASTKRPLVEVLREEGIDPAGIRYALATHLHWDHIGALRDLPNAKILIGQQELESARRLHHWVEEGVMPHHLASVKERLATFPFNGGPRDGFNTSFDVFGDGSIVAVPLPGHTDGSTGFWVTDLTGHHWLFIGDAAWTAHGVEKPAHKTVPIDSNLIELSNTLGLLHAIFANRPDVTIVPAHDERALSLLPACGAH